MKNKIRKVIKIITKTKEEFEYVKIILMERGVKFFIKPVFIGILLILILYTQIYQAAERDIFFKTDAIKAAQIQAENLEDYLKDKNNLIALGKMLPDIKDKSSWLLDKLTTILEENNVLASRISEQKEKDLGKFTSVNIKITLTVSYEELGKILQSIENDDIFLKVVALNLAKKGGQEELLGYNEIDMEVSTVFYKEPIT